MTLACADGRAVVLSSVPGLYFGCRVRLSARPRGRVRSSGSRCTPVAWRYANSVIDQLALSLE